MIDVTAIDDISGDARARSNVVRLAAAPLSMYVLGIAAGTLPTGAISRAYGRRVAFIVGTGCGTLTGLLAAFAILCGSFALFCCATFLGGLYGAVSQSYR